MAQSGYLIISMINSCSSKVLNVLLQPLLYFNVLAAGEKNQVPVIRYDIGAPARPAKRRATRAKIELPTLDYPKRSYTSEQAMARMSHPQPSICGSRAARIIRYLRACVMVLNGVDGFVESKSGEKEWEKEKEKEKGTDGVKIYISSLESPPPSHRDISSFFSSFLRKYFYLLQS